MCKAGGDVSGLFGLSPRAASAWGFFVDYGVHPYMRYRTFAGTSNVKRPAHNFARQRRTSNVERGTSNVQRYSYS